MNLQKKGLSKENKKRECAVHFSSGLCNFSLKCFVTGHLWQCSSLQRFCKYICRSSLGWITAEYRDTRGGCPNKLFLQPLKARAANTRGHEITSVFHLLQKMASNKVQTVLGGRVVRRWGRRRWRQTVTDSFPATAICCVAVALGREPIPIGYCLHQLTALSALCWGNTAKRERRAAWATGLLRPGGLWETPDTSAGGYFPNKLTSVGGNVCQKEAKFIGDIVPRSAHVYGYFCSSLHAGSKLSADPQRHRRQ